MAKVYDVPADVMIGKLAEILKNEDIPAPSWIPFVKTGAHADKPPQNRDWWHTRCASILRKIYLHGPIGINELRKDYGGVVNLQVMVLLIIKMLVVQLSEMLFMD